MKITTHIALAVSLIILSTVSVSRAADKTKVLIYGVSGGRADVAPKAIAENLSKLIASSSDKGIEVEWKASKGSILMEAIHHPEYKAETIKAITAGFDYVVLVDSPSYALKYPEFHFEGICQLSARIKKAKAAPLLLMLWNKTLSATDAYGQLAYRVGKGTETPVIPTGYLLSEIKKDAGQLSPEGISYCAAVSIYTQIKDKEITNVKLKPPDIQNLRAPIAKTAYNVLTKHKKATHYKDSCAKRGIVRLKPIDMPRTDNFLMMSTGTSTEAGWRRHISRLLKQTKTPAKITGLKNDDRSRCFSASDLKTAQPFLKAAGNQYLILFARNYDISSAKVIADNQKYLQCQIYDKAEPRPRKTYTLKGVSALLFSHHRVLTKYNSAIKNDLSMIPLHIAVARVYDQRPDLLFSKDRTHMTAPFLYMLAGMSYTSRTGKKPPTKGLDADTIFTIGVGYQTVTQLANLSKSGSYIPEH